MAKILIPVLLALALAANPTDPKWPNQFTQDFTEKTTYPLIGSHTNTGTFIYDYTNGAYRVDRSNGRYDRYCGLNGSKAFEDTACSHIVVDGKRYMYYPDKNECCYCCDESHGCGLVKPDWLSGATFEGQTTYNGQSAYKWDQKGLQDNFYYETISDNPLDRIMLDLNQQPNDDMVFSGKRELSVDSKKLELPSICSTKNTCSILSTCTALRGFN